MAASQIVEISARIAANTAKLNDYLTAHNLPSPSFTEDGPSETLIPKDELEVEAARVSIIDDTAELRRLVLGPREYLMSFTVSPRPITLLEDDIPMNECLGIANFSSQHNELISQQAIVRFRLAHSFTAGAEATFGEIAAFSGLPETTVRQIIRHAIVKGIFTEPRPGVVAHNAVSRLLAEDQVIHDWVGASTDDLWQGAAQTCNALVKFPGSQEPNETVRTQSLSYDSFHN